MSIETLLSDWRNAAAELNTIKAREMRLRLELYQLLASADPRLLQEGAHTVEIPGRHAKVKIGTKYNRTLDAAVLPSVFAKLREMQINPDPLIKNTPELVIKEYRKLQGDAKLAFDEAVVTKPGAPSLEYVELPQE